MKLGNLIILILIIALVIGGFFGWREYQKYKQEKYINDNIKYYNGFKFTQFRGMWHTNIQADKTLYTLEFRFLPNQTENISMKGEIKDFSNNKVYVTFDPLGKNLSYISLAAYDISSNLAAVFNVEPIASCTRQDNSTCLSRPIVSCANESNSVIFIKTDEKAEIAMEGSCITISGHGLDIVRSVDKFLYFLLGIIRV